MYSIYSSNKKHLHRLLRGRQHRTKEHSGKKPRIKFKHDFLWEAVFPPLDGSLLTSTGYNLPVILLDLYTRLLHLFKWCPVIAKEKLELRETRKSLQKATPLLGGHYFNM